MNNFEAKYMKISSHYLTDKMKQLNVRSNKTDPLEKKQMSTINKIVTGIFK